MCSNAACRTAPHCCMRRCKCQPHDRSSPASRLLAGARPALHGVRAGVRLRPRLPARRQPGGGVRGRVAAGDQRARRLQRLHLCLRPDRRARGPGAPLPGHQASAREEAACAKVRHRSARGRPERRRHASQQRASARNPPRRAAQPAPGAPRVPAERSRAGSASCGARPRPPARARLPLTGGQRGAQARARRTQCWARRRTLVSTSGPCASSSGARNPTLPRPAPCARPAPRRAARPLHGLRPSACGMHAGGVLPALPCLSMGLRDHGI